MLWKKLSVHPEAADFYKRIHDAFDRVLQLRSELAISRFGRETRWTPVTFVERTDIGPKTVEVAGRDTSLTAFITCFVMEIEKDKKCERSFLPTVRALRFIEGRIDRDFSEPRLTKLHEELVKTHRELIKQVTDLIRDEASRNDCMAFPAQNVIEQLSRYREYCASVSQNCITVRTDLLNFKNRFRETIDRFRNLHQTFLKGFAIPNFQAKRIRSIVESDSLCALSQRKLLLVKEVVKRAGITNPHEWSALRFLEQEVEFFKKLVGLAKQGKFEVIPDLISVNFDNYTAADREMAAEKNDVLAARSRAETEKDRWYGKRAKPVDGEMMERLHISRKETDIALQELEMVKQECEQSLKDSIGRISTIVERLPECGIIPSNFEAIIRVLTEKKAKKMWLQGKVSAQRDRVSKLKQKVADLREESDQLTQLLVEKQQQFEELKVKSETSEPIESVVDKEKFEELKSLKHCKICSGYGKRDTFLMQCKHSFCRTCVASLVTQRSRFCPYCGTRFDPTKDVQRIRWRKRKDRY
jgi:hypothetical protein